MQKYLDKAREFGFTQAAFLENFPLKCKPELRAYCNPQECQNHG